MLSYCQLTSVLKDSLHLISYLTRSVTGSGKKGSATNGRRRSSFIVTPNGDCHKTTLEYVLPLLLLPVLLGRQGLLTAWVIYLYPLDTILRHLRHYWSRSSPTLWQSIDRLETKFLATSTANLMNQILFFTLTERWLNLDRRTSLYTLIVYNFMVYCIKYLKELRFRGDETWATVSISSSTNIRHLAMSATKLVLEWAKLVTFVATLVTFLIVLLLDSSTTNLFPPLRFTLLTLTYYILSEEEIKLSTPNKFIRYGISIEQIQGLESLYLHVLQNGVTLLLNLALIIPSFRSNPKLCIIATYHNVYLQYKNHKRLVGVIDEEWERISDFRKANQEEVQELDDVCAVCLSPLANQVRVTKCRHFFHANCLRLYLKESRLDSCPICKRTL